MAYNTEELEKQALQSIKKHKVTFIEHLVSHLPCDKTTFYAHNLHKSRKIISEINNNRISLKSENKEYNKEKKSARIKKRYSEDGKFRLSTSVRASLHIRLKNRDIVKKESTFKSLGYTISDLVKHLESKFDKYMEWDNYGSYWHIDHIIPDSWFSYESQEDPEFKACWGLSNLQPLEASENICKSNKYCESTQLGLTLV